MLLAKRIALAAVAACGCVPAGASAGTFTTLYAFSGSADGGNPGTPLIYHDGRLYGTVPTHPFSYIGGNVFKVNAATGAFKVIYSFLGGSDGNQPGAGVIEHDGVLFGTTAVGGGSGCVIAGHTYGCGTIFAINLKTNAESVLYSFSQNPNASPAYPGDLVYIAGSLYGTTSAEGANNAGSVFAFNPTSGAFTTISSFGGAAGAGPNPVLLYHNGLFYGTTAAGGKGCTGFHGCGVVFSIDPSTGAESVLHEFGSLAGGRIPYSNLIYHENALIGDTAIGGDTENFRRGEGVSFSIKARTGREKVLRTFLTRNQNYSALTLVGNIVYITLPAGGRNGYGALDQLDLTTGQQTVLHTFTGGADGSNPQAPVLYQDGILYGSTYSGGPIEGDCLGGHGCGTIFKYVP